VAANESRRVAEQRLLVDNLVDAVRIFPDRLTVQVFGAPPILVTLDEVGLRPDIKPVVPETRRDRSATLHWRLSD